MAEHPFPPPTITQWLNHETVIAEKLVEELNWWALKMAGLDPELMLIRIGDAASLERHLAWLYPRVPCKCEHEYLPAGRLYGVNMGKSWQRVTTHPLCPHHGDKAQAYFKKHRHWAGPEGIT